MTRSKSEGFGPWLKGNLLKRRSPSTRFRNPSHILVLSLKEVNQTDQIWKMTGIDEFGVYIEWVLNGANKRHWDEIYEVIGHD